MKPKQTTSHIVSLLALTAGISICAELLPTTASEQQALTPSAVLKELKEGTIEWLE